jgi:transposase-like protein
VKKYTTEIKESCVAMIKEGKTLVEVSKVLGPNKKAIIRYCKEAGVEVDTKKK